MAKVHKIENADRPGDLQYFFMCPACNQIHGLNHSWKFNGNFDHPTFSPSILVTWTHAGKEKHRCHSFITDGFIKFEHDSTHAMGGERVELPEIDPSKF